MIYGSTKYLSSTIESASLSFWTVRIGLLIEVVMGNGESGVNCQNEESRERDWGVY